ncbi:MAG: hypothetical protein F7C82_04705 [Desulfurococcales archaeon]|nr:hypothetical protein [Desulfurococcales archaeon]
MKPTQYFSISIIIIVFLSALVYATYPLKYDENMGLLESTGQKSSPGFVSGVAGVGSIQGYVKITGIVVAHGVLEAGDREVPFMIVKSNGKEYTVLLGSNAENYLKEEYNEDIDIHVYPIQMMNHNVTITGIKTSVDNIIIATSMSMSCTGMQNMPHHMPGGDDDWYDDDYNRMPMMTCTHSP